MGIVHADFPESEKDFSPKSLRIDRVPDFQVAAGEVTALVSGSSIYKISVKIAPVP
jgi:hypothetical protein